MKRTRMSATSRKRAACLPVWKALRQNIIERDGGHCVMCPAMDGLDPHHRKLKSRGGMDEHANLITLCRKHHDLAHHNPAWAEAVGLLCPSWAVPFDWPVFLRYDRGPWGWAEPMLWQVPNDDGEWVCRSPHPDQNASPAPWEVAS